MSIEIRTTFNGKCHEVYVGDLTLLFSYETLIGFAVPGVGRITSEIVWGSTTGKHINSFPARYSRVKRETFRRAEAMLDVFFKGRSSIDELRGNLLGLLAETEDER